MIIIKYPYYSYKILMKFILPSLTNQQIITHHNITERNKIIFNV